MLCNFYTYLLKVGTTENKSGMALAASSMCRFRDFMTHVLCALRFPIILTQLKDFDWNSSDDRYLMARSMLKKDHCYIISSRSRSNLKPTSTSIRSRSNSETSDFKISIVRNLWPMQFWDWGNPTIAAALQPHAIRLQLNQRQKYYLLGLN